MSLSRKTVLAGALGFFLVWMALFLRRYRQEDAELVLRFVLGLFFALAILLRSRLAPREAEADVSGSARGERTEARAAWMSAAAGAGLMAAGLFAPIRQFEWLGVLLLLYACLRWALPRAYARDLLPALFLLYWIHPLPGQLFDTFQFGMQRASVQGAEWLLHMFNRRVWADGFALHAGTRVFGVPEACSGMRTAATVLMCALGLGVLFRLRSVEVALFAVAGIAQVLLLNVVRIAALVALAENRPPDWGETALHDTLWVFLLAALILIQTEMALWKRFRLKRRLGRQAVEAGEAEPPDLGSYLPRIWTHLHCWRWRIIAGALALLLVAAAGYRRRPHHRAAMADNVADTLLRSDIVAAERAARATLALQPTRERSVRLAHVLVLRGKHEQGLAVLAGLDGELAPFETVLKSWALMAMDRMEEGVRLIEDMPPAQRRFPAVAIFLAEYAVRRNRPEDVAEPLANAAVSHAMIGRVRALFPYLARHDLWPTIAACNHPSPFEHLSEALVAIEANLRVRNTAWAARILEQALRVWPQEPLLIGSLFSLAERRPGGEWERRFAEYIQANFERLDADDLAASLGYAFRLVRPDLGWTLYRRLEELDAADPALFLVAAQYAAAWFTFRKHQLGRVSAHPGETVCLRRDYAEKRDDPAFVSRWRAIPHAETMALGDPVRIRKAFVEKALSELERREQQGGLSRRMERSLPFALSMAGRFDAARERLEQWSERYPEERSEALYLLVVLEAQRGDWQAVYERARLYEEGVRYPRLKARLLKAQALAGMNLGVPAMAVARLVRRDYPDSHLGRLIEATIWDAFGFQEEALFVLSQTGPLPGTPAVALQLFATGRYREAETMARALGDDRPVFEETRPGWLVHPAERTVAGVWPAPPGDPAAQADALRTRAEKAGSPFLRRLFALEADRLSGGRQPDPQTIKAWAAAGRDDLERAAALHRLALGLAGEGHRELALAAVRRALVSLPESAVLWRMAVVLSEGDRDLVAQARQACPDDPDLWLADWVARVREDHARERVESERYRVDLEKDIGAQTYSPGAMVRLADFLLRQGLSEAAAMAARDAQARGRGMMSATIMALRCAWALRDADWARASALAGADYARDPRPFHEMLVNLGFSERTMDADLVRALEWLHRHFPQQTEWGERLGFVHFQRGEWSRAWDALSVAMDSDFKGLRLNSLLMAAESARLQGRHRQAVAVLERLFREHPNNPVVLNNLVYTLAQDPATAARAAELLPALLEKDRLPFQALDTAAVVHWKTGRIARAREYSARALAAVDETDPAAREVRANAADILLAAGDAERALALIEPVVRQSGLAPSLERRTRETRERARKVVLAGRIEAARALARQGESGEASRRVRDLLREARLPAELEAQARALIEDIEAGRP